MPLHRLDISQLRNLSNVRLQPSPQVNLISGANGSGKTSVLEAIHLLSLGRSFRSHKHKTYIQKETSECVIFALLEQAETASGMRQSPQPIGLKRQLDGSLDARVSGQKIQSLVELTQALPVQLINPDAFRLLEGSPKIRRQFLDWGVFHHATGFINAWRGWQKALKQRNSLLRRGKISDSLLLAFDHELIRLGSEVNQYRHDYLDRLIPVFKQVLLSLNAELEVNLQLYQGWDAQKSLAQVLDASRTRDIESGYSNTGPQRADLRVKTPHGDALDALSRGQQKLVVSALKIAQGKLLIESGRSIVFLVDDLPAELDKEHRDKLCQLLEALDSQIFITSVGPEIMDYDWSETTDVRHFAMKAGELSHYPSDALQES
ncbi:recombinase RecF [Marinomonas sp. SBI22]|uniref:DNA replication/repair protein RecF n=1 Tax=unclassified Marinomonas TaxID=196814 RepID=UPI0007AEFD61|nr:MULTISPECIES: DNA replication/repair protein RecF [unclassified Marinomonas]KZM40521.1 recombinase RecF [Marinomonas sp. SBI22]KZM42224.1 recombinase RecF [Marinomonas sp. SBI8L]